VTSEWYAALHARPEFMAAAADQRRQAEALALAYPHVPYQGPNFRGAARQMARDFAALGVTVTAEELEQRARELYAEGVG
jgi:hypothetical protein